MKRFAVLVLVLVVCTPVTALAAKTGDSCVIVANPTKQHHTSCSHVFQWRPDLSGADLRYASLDTVVLVGVNLSHANLSNARLTDIPLMDANLSHANLSNASLYIVSLYGAKLAGANLNGTKFCQVFMPNGRINNSSCQGKHR
jgi:uncharacterized protein YjbI with pentapeptide repeats